jgi:hypothetical protein
MTQIRAAKVPGLAFALLVLIAWGLQGELTAVAQDAVPAKPAEGPSETDLSTRYRFIERYAAPGARPDPLSVGQYQVGISETIQHITERPQGAPIRVDDNYITRYSERAAHVGSSGEVTDTVRRYATFRKRPDPFKPTDPRPLEGLTLWYHAGARGAEPRLMSLDEGRRLHEKEYLLISNQHFLPELRTLLPAVPSRIGDTWKISNSAAFAMRKGERVSWGSFRPCEKALMAGSRSR